MNEIKVLYYFEEKDGRECFIELKLGKSEYQWYHCVGKKIYTLEFLACGVTIEGENFRILRRNKKPFLMLFDDEFMKVSDRDIIFCKKETSTVSSKLIQDCIEN